MSKKTVCIYAPYDASEPTLCAAFLADHIAYRYRYVVWVSPKGIFHGSRYSGFSQKWDGVVLSLATQLDVITKKLTDCEMCIFFEESELLYSVLPKGTKKAVLMNPYTWCHETSPAFAKKCEYAVSVSPYVSKKIVRPHLLSNEVRMPFAPPLRWTPRHNLQTGERSVLFYNAYGMSYPERECIEQVADTVKVCCPQSKSVIGYYDKKEKSRPGRDARVYDWQMIKYLEHTDWIVDLSQKPLLTLFPMMAGVIGAQWSGFDLPPNNDDYNATRRHLIPYPSGGLTIDSAGVIAEHLVRHLTKPFATEADKNQSAWSSQDRSSKFMGVMNRWFKRKKHEKKYTEIQQKETLRQQ